MESLIAGERLMEALELADNEQREMDEHNAVVERLKRQGETRFPSHRPNPLLYNLTPTRFGTWEIRWLLRDVRDFAHSRCVCAICSSVRAASDQGTRARASAADFAVRSRVPADLVPGEAAEGEPGRRA